MPACVALTACCVQYGCLDDPFVHVISTGEYMLYCRPSTRERPLLGPKTGGPVLLPR
jgi:hypothetical protein